MTKQGCCKYCGNFRMVEVTESATQDQTDKKATKECDCEMANMLRFFAASGMYEDEDQEFIMSIVRSLQKQIDRIGQLSFKTGEDTFTLTPLASGKIKVKRRHTESEEHRF